MAIFDDEFVDEDTEDLSGFEIIDREKLFVAFAERDQETVASEIPVNEQKALVFDVNTQIFVLGARLDFDFSESLCELTANNERACSLKPAFVDKIKTERAGQYARITVFSTEPAMIKIEYSAAKRKNFKLI